MVDILSRSTSLSQSVVPKLVCIRLTQLQKSSQMKLSNLLILKGAYDHLLCPRGFLNHVSANMVL